MPTRPATSVGELRVALQNLALAASGTARLLRSKAKRKSLNQAISHACDVLRADLPEKPCAECLRRAAAQADTAREIEPGYRKDLDG